MEDLPLGRIAALVPKFAVKNLPLGRTLMMMMMNEEYRIYVTRAKSDILHTACTEMFSSEPQAKGWNFKMNMHNTFPLITYNILCHIMLKIILYI